MNDETINRLVNDANSSGQPLIAHISLDNSEAQDVPRESAEELDLRVYFRLFLRWLWLLILCAILSGASAFYISSISTPIYRATTTMMIDEAVNSPSEYQGILVSERKARTYAQMMTHTPLRDKVAGQINLDPAVFSSDITNISVTPVRDTQLVQVRVEGVSPSLVALVANTLPESFISELAESQTQRFEESKENLQEQLALISAEIELKQVEIESFGDSLTSAEEIEIGQLRNALTFSQNNYANLLRNFEEIRLEEARSQDTIIVTEPARIPRSPIRPRVLVNTLLAAVVGAMLALGLVFLIEYLDDRVKSPKAVRRLFNLPFLGAISYIDNTAPKGTPDQKLITLTEPRNPISEAYRGIRTNLQFSNIDSQVRSLVVTSSEPGEGKSTTAANLAIVLAQSGMSVALIDADLRRPSLHTIFRVSQRPGLIDTLLSDDTSKLRYSPQRNIKNLLITPCGQRPPNPSELLGSKRMKHLIEGLQEQVDLVILDAPPLLAVTDAQILSAYVDGVLFVVDSATKRKAIRQAVESLRQVNANILGFVMNRMTRSDDGDYYYYSYYYDENPRTNITQEVPVYQNGKSAGAYDVVNQRTSTITPIAVTRQDQ
ncbi:MAG: polysaccharide biosynthesis tyrosine autokinase [Chloroflexota bacterium]